MIETQNLFINDKKKRSKILSFLSIEDMSEQNIYKRWEYLMSISNLDVAGLMQCIVEKFNFFPTLDLDGKIRLMMRCILHTICFDCFFFACIVPILIRAHLSSVVNDMPDT